MTPDTLALAAFYDPATGKVAAVPLSWALAQLAHEPPPLRCPDCTWSVGGGQKKPRVMRRCPVHAAVGIAGEFAHDGHQTRPSNQRLDDARRAQIERGLADGESHAHIARRVKCNKNTVGLVAKKLRAGRAA